MLLKLYVPSAATGLVATITLLVFTKLTYNTAPRFVPVPSTFVLVNPFMSLNTVPFKSLFTKGIFADPLINDCTPALSIVT